MPLSRLIPLTALCGLLTPAAWADTQVFTGESTTLDAQTVSVPAFDGEGRFHLDAVHLDLYASQFGGYTISGSGDRVFVACWYTQGYSLDGEPLLDVTSRFALSMKNDEMMAYTFWKTGDASLSLTDEADLERWQEGEAVELETVGDWDYLAWRPLDLLDLGVSLDGTWTVTYEFSPL